MEDNLQLQFDEEKELGDILFEYDDTDTILNSSIKTKRALKSPWTYYFLAALLFLLGWIIYGAIAMNKEYGDKVATLMSISNFFVFVCLVFFTVTIIFGLWGRILRFGMRNPEYLNKTGAEKYQQRRAIGAMLAAENQKPHRNAFRVYKNYIEIVNDGKNTYYKKEHVNRIVIIKNRKKFKVKMISNTLKLANADVKIPTEFLGNFVRSCSDIPIQYENLLRYDTRIRPDKSVGSLVGLTLFLLIPIAAGSAIIWAHYKVNEEMPMFLGIFFILAGALGICGLYSFVPFIKHVILPMFFGIMFVITPVLLTKQFFVQIDIEFNIHNYFTFINPMTLGFTYIMAIGLVVIFAAVRSMIDYFIYVIKK